MQNMYVVWFNVFGSLIGIGAITTTHTSMGLPINTKKYLHMNEWDGKKTSTKNQIESTEKQCKLIKKMNKMRFDANIFLKIK